MNTQEQMMGSLFQPDTLLAESVLETARSKLHLEPEKDLMMSVLEDAVYCFQKNIFAQTVKETVLFQEAEDWILEESSHWLFSFENICETLNIDPKYLRKGLIDWKRRKLKDHHKVNKRYRTISKPPVSHSFLKTSTSDGEQAFAEALTA